MQTREPRSKVVLSLDDDVEVCALLEHILWPHRVIGVAHAYVALELLAREAFDLFILDLKLPDMDGLQLCTRIRQLDPNAPIVFCSGAVNPDDRLAALGAGASAYYGKPLDPEAFQSGIEQLLYESEDRNRCAEEAARALLGGYAGTRALDAAPDDDEGPVAALRETVYRRFIEAGGTRAHFLRAWPAMLEDLPRAGAAGQPAAPAIGRPGA